MDKSLEEILMRRFERSLSSVSIKAVENVEADITIGGRKRNADCFEAVIKGDIFRLYMKVITLHKTFFKEGEVYQEYELDGVSVKPFTLREILVLLRDAGYRVSDALFESGRDNYTIKKTAIERDERGLEKFFSSLRTFSIQSVRLVLNYDAEGDGEFSLSLLLGSPELIDTGHLRRLELGRGDYGKITRDKKDAIIKYLNALNTFVMNAGLEIFNIVDYLSIVEEIERKDKSRDFSFAIEKGRTEYSINNPSFGGEAYSDFGFNLTPLDFAWYLNGYSDTESQREAFFSHYDRANARSKEYYLGVLGLKSPASWAEVHKAYKNMVQRFHPDRLSSYDLDPSFLSFANEQMQRANDAYEKLRKMITS